MTDRDPFSEIDELFERMNRELNQLGRQFDTRVSSGGIAVDVVEHDEELVVSADLPGFETDDIDITVHEGTLTVDAERDEETEKSAAEVGDGPRYHRRERRRKSASRRVRLPVDVDETAASATYTNGVLTVTLPKETEMEGGHTIDVE